MPKGAKKDRKSRKQAVTAPAAAEEKKLPAHVEEMRTKVFVSRQRVTHAKEVEDPNAYAAYGIDNSFNLDEFKKELKITIQERSDERIVFDLIGTTAPIANAMRRIMLEEVPTMAIEQVDMYQNTSLLGDEILAHRLGLIPIKADPRKFDYLEEANGNKHELNTLLFTLDVECTINEGCSDASPNHIKYNNHMVYSSALKWVPQGRQAEIFKDDPIKPVFDDIVIAELRPGQRIEAELYVQKGLGKDHAKWSPVATAFYRLLPEVNFAKPITGKPARDLVALCPMKVFDLEDLGQTVQARAANPRNCSMCRECVRYEPFSELVQLRRDRRHFIFSVESVGMYLPEDIVREALRELMSKIQVVLDSLKEGQGQNKTKESEAMEIDESGSD